MTEKGRIVVFYIHLMTDSTLKMYSHNISSTDLGYIQDPNLIINVPADVLTHWGRNKMAAILQTIFSNSFSWMKMYESRLKLHWSLFPRAQLTIFQHWLRITERRKRHCTLFLLLVITGKQSLLYRYNNIVLRYLFENRVVFLYDEKTVDCFLVITR